MTQIVSIGCANIHFTAPCGIYNDSQIFIFVDPFNLNAIEIEFWFYVIAKYHELCFHFVNYQPFLTKLQKAIKLSL